MPKYSTVREIVHKIRSSEGNERASAERQLYEKIITRFRPLAGGKLNTLTRRTVNASDIVNIALKSILSDLQSGKLDTAGDPVNSWSALILGYVNKKFKQAIRDQIAIKRGRGKPPTPIDITGVPAVGDQLSLEALDQFVNNLESKLPEKDGTRVILRKYFLGDYDQEQLAKELGRDVRTIQRKWRVLQGHLADICISEANLDADVEETVRMVIDPRRWVRVTAKKGDRRSLLERRIEAVAHKLGISERQVIRRVARAHEGFVNLIE